MDIIYKQPKGFGWSPITYMVSLAGELFETRPRIIEGKSASRLDKLKLMIPGFKEREGQDSCLLICPAPGDLLSLSTVRGWRKKYRFIAAWVIDSFWTEHIPRSFRISHPFDHLFITSREDADEWGRQMNIPVTWLPWGSDVLRLGGGQSDRRWDLLRVGRQPAQWDDDAATAAACRQRNLRFHGRPELLTDAMENQRLIMDLYRRSRFLLAFSNQANPTNYTHPVRDYITGRWADALACGAAVAGIAPRDPSIETLLWEGALLDLPCLDREKGLDAIADHAGSWHPRHAQINYVQALKKLDWRWRFQTIASVFNLNPERLKDEIQLLKQRSGAGR